ncbi:unnamed protein product [Periconia digitata]|uniref:Uncharacterized protein n=1 Tax=Periconia digitata TaxID=1303443 RepID=A0A9W4UBC0_9PLEO|nr:unnamed protein product [Periconia digitata]
MSCFFPSLASLTPDQMNTSYHFPTRTQYKSHNREERKKDSPHIPPPPSHHHHNNSGPFSTNITTNPCRHTHPRPVPSPAPSTQPATAAKPIQPPVSLPKTRQHFRFAPGPTH